ncbi:MAG: TetR/AcrR family transcriptional regulator [Microbacteriaceae bacterium]
MQNTSLSLRERNRIEAWETIHDAAASIALEDGPMVATVDLIAARAGISRRTFFNYFSSKEDAVLGLSEPTVSNESLTAFHSSTEPIVTAAVYLMADVFRSAGPQGSASVRPIALIRKYPELRGRLGLHARAVLALVTPVIAEKMESDANKARRSNVNPVESSEPAAVAMFAGTILKFAYANNLNAVVNGDNSALEDAISMFRKVAATSL